MPTQRRLERTLTLLEQADIKAFPAGAASLDNAGNLIPPGGASEFAVVDLIVETPSRAAMCITGIATQIQITCLATLPSKTLDLLTAVRDALPFPEYDPGVTGSTGRLPSPARPYHGVFQRYTIHHSPADNPLSS